MSSLTVPWYLPIFEFNSLPGLETILIPLPEDLPFLEFQKHGKKGPQLPARRNRSKGDSQPSDPSTSSATRSSSAISCFILYICRDMNFLPRSAPSRAAAKSRLLPSGVSRLGNSSKITSGSKKSTKRCSRLSSFESLQVSPCDLHIASRFAYFRLQEWAVLEPPI